jgi:nucleoid-associated protein YgaU
MADTGRLERLTIQAFETPDYTGSPAGVFQAYVNPAEFTIAYEMEYDSAQGAGTTNSRMEFKKEKPGDLTLNFFIDGTGANGRKENVQQKIEEFKKVTGYNGNIHRPNYLKVGWGTIEIKRCVLKSASIAYKLFKPDGVPLRAVVTANFTGNSDDQTRVARAQNKSSDLTHVRMVKAGDTLPAMCFHIYGNPALYLKVAGFNGLDDFRRLQPGTTIRFPPLKK